MPLKGQKILVSSVQILIEIDKVEDIKSVDVLFKKNYVKRLMNN